MSNSLYTRKSPSFSAKLVELAPESFQAFGEFNKHALGAGALSVKTKELIAVAAAHITGCPYCIEAHVGKAKGENAEFQELLEAIIVATAVSAHSTFYNASNAWNAYAGSAGEELYPRSNLQLIEKLEETNEEQYTLFAAYVNTALKPKLVSAKEKLLIAVGSAHITGNPYSLELFTQKAKEEGITLQEITETILVATALKAGSALAHRVNALEAYERS